MTDTLSQLFRALNLGVIERLPNGWFHLLTVPPAWLEKALDEAPPGGRDSIDAAFPFLEDVIHQAIGAWGAGPHASIVCGPFAATVGGDDLLLRATALTVDGRTLLVLERLLGSADSRPMLQKAREHLLEHEQLVRQVTTLHAPVAAIERAVAQLAATTVSPEQARAMTALGEAQAALKTAMTGLPTPPTRTRR